MEQAMSMVMTGGAVGPETVEYTKAYVSEDGAASSA
jgi:hypothetical protein